MPLFCPQCGTALKPDAKFCEECGTQIIANGSSGASSRRGISFAVLAFILLVGGVVAAFFFFSRDDDRASVAKVDKRGSGRIGERFEGTSSSVEEATFPFRQTIEKFLKALQEGDFKTIFAAMVSYQSAIADIKSKNPQTLWNSLTERYYLQEKANFESAAQSMPTDFSFGTSISSLRNLQIFCSSAAVKVIEERKGISPVGKEISQMFVKFSYSTLASAPLISGSGFLKEAIFEFHVDTNSALILSFSHLDTGDVFWLQSLEVAEAFYKRQMYRETINTINSLGSDLNNTAVRELLANSYYGIALSEFFGKHSFAAEHEFGIKKGFEALDTACRINPSLKSQWVPEAVKIANHYRTAGIKHLERMVLNETLQLIPENREIRGMLIQSYLEDNSGNRTSTLEKVLELDSSNEEVKRNLVQLYTDRVRGGNAAPTELARLFYRALQLDPALKVDLPAHLKSRLAVGFKRMGTGEMGQEESDLQKVTLFTRKAYEIDPEGEHSCDFAYDLARYSVRAEQEKEARKWLELLQATVAKHRGRETLGLPGLQIAVPRN